MGEPVTLPFLDDYTPDLPVLEGGSNTSYQNCGPSGVINIGRSFATFGAHTIITATAGIGDLPLGMFSFRASNGTYYTIGGIDDTLKLVNGANWTDVSRTAGGAYATAAGDRWNFAAFGNRVIAVNYTDATQTYLAGTDTDFSALAATAPKAKYIDVAGDFVVLGYVNDGTVYPFRVQWCAQGDPTAVWTASATTQADYQDMNSNYGVVTGIAGHENGFYVFQERAITPFTYVGSPLVFVRGESIVGEGCVIPSSLCKAGGSCFFVSSNGIKKFNGSSVEHIGLGKVDQTLWAVHTLSANKFFTAFADPNYPVVHFSLIFQSTAIALFSYNYVVNKWTYLPTGIMYNYGVIYNSTYPSGVVAAFENGAYKLGSFTGTALAGIFYTRFFLASNDGGRGSVSRVRVISDQAAPTSVSLQTVTSEHLSGSSYSTTAMTAVGNNNQYTARVVESVVFRIQAQIDPWVYTNKLNAVQLLEWSGNKR